MNAPRHTWVPYVAAAAGAAFTLKVMLIFASGNAVSETPMVVLYLGGLLLGIVAAVGTGLRQPVLGRRIAVGLGLTVLLILWIMGLGEAVEPVVGLFSDAKYIQEETPILLAGLVLLALAFRARSRDLDATAAPVMAT